MNNIFFLQNYFLQTKITFYLLYMYITQSEILSGIFDNYGGTSGTIFDNYRRHYVGEVQILNV